MLVLKAEQLRREWNGKTLFEQADLEISAGEHVALIGRNGVGKTTLLHLLTGAISSDDGKVYRRYPAEQWGWLKQNLHLEEEVTVIDFVRSGLPDLFQLKKKLETLQKRLETSGTDNRSLEGLVEKFSRVQQQYSDLGGYEWELKVEKTLMQLQLSPDMWQLPFRQLSGGQKTRAQLARLLIDNPPFLILDEPTNHLDRETLEWLETWVRQFPGAVLFVSHDRSFIDRVADTTYELTPAGTKRYKGGYREFREQRELEQRTQQALYKRQERERQELLESIQRYRQWFHRAHDAAGERNPGLKKKANKNMTRFRAKERALERLEKNRVERPREDQQLQVTFEQGDFTARTLVQLDNVTFSYGEKPIFQNVRISVNRGDRVAVIGPNGTGKTTLLKLLSGLLTPESGNVIHHPQLTIGYFAQELEELSEADTILDSLLNLPNMTQSYARTILASFLFRGDDVFKKIGELSMGERCRVAFVKLYFSGANLLVLDEPTNYLDIDTREQIEDALSNYPGSLIVVSHDRYLLQKVANKVVDLEKRPVSLFPGTYSEYVEQTKQQPSTASEPSKQNRIRELELQLTQLITQEEREDPQERDKLLAAIRKTRALLNELMASD